ncbi:hypothetical protein MJO28_016359 [Puccinia striiformis f. sp. tritici]|uniref:Uncharacterized protein n=4 Tax=Puccinia striiformis TaxID=27350 RepID=A0A0L0VZH6_9BASI|nr:hypothetical protein Pst134EA_030513 [Puccinia striiformis f. sp. tritici]KAI9600563.1 hypothetical protein H4Q26_000350 [Puccinia striiformis f. sp. tritici PST-130]KNF04602.1 hypothetical protein PSTG_02089 [Puccinia striiformis f. sp. tritici PST-78]POW13533.1 hypothetical protein PSTT_03715 [Puccinia striiformis]KAH9440444.1 hypothetical protein Pst134EB_031056 [Puccinia striiformis f. sp. tritici]KAH9446602.1 hypothetical protein Pst134EA_030513 [Puccinia striiformis f. sp. tritici]
MPVQFHQEDSDTQLQHIVSKACPGFNLNDPWAIPRLIPQSPTSKRLLLVQTMSLGPFNGLPFKFPSACSHRQEEIKSKSTSNAQLLNNALCPSMEHVLKPGPFNGLPIKSSSAYPHRQEEVKSKPTSNAQLLIR